MFHLFAEKSQARKILLRKCRPEKNRGFADPLPPAVCHRERGPRDDSSNLGARRRPHGQRVDEVRFFRPAYFVKTILTSVVIVAAPRTRDNLVVCGNALQLANLRFEGRYPEVTKALLMSFENVEKKKHLENAFEDQLKLGILFSNHFK